MSGMRRADRGNSNDDNARKYPVARQQEPTSAHELKQLLATARSQRDEVRSELDVKKQCLEETSARLAQTEEEVQISRIEVDQWKERTHQNHQLYLEEQQRYQQTLCLYDQEKARAIELLAKYEEADAQRAQYLSLYNEVQAELKSERRSKAGIKGWETRRKRENERLKQEIGEMTVLLRESLARKDEAVDSLYLLAERMDRIQTLVDSVEDESTNNPINLLQKLKRIWLNIKDILNE
jgi:hypothetical protein